MFKWLAIIIGTVFLDQLTKYLTVLYLKAVDTVPLMEGVLHLTYVENTGAAFGMLKDHRWVFMVISTVAILALLVYLLWKKPTSALECLSLSFIVGGGIGNMIDRLLLGYVVDMIDFRLINFAVFNVADSFVCVGAGMLMLYLIRSIIEEYKQEKALAAGGTAEDSAEDSAEAPAEDSIEAPAEDSAVEPAETPAEDETHE